MSETLPFTTREFGCAVCEHLGLDPEKVAFPFTITAEGDDTLMIRLNVQLTPDDLRAIAEQMDKARTK